MTDGSTYRKIFIDHLLEQTRKRLADQLLGAMYQGSHENVPCGAHYSETSDGRRVTLFSIQVTVLCPQPLQFTMAHGKLMTNYAASREVAGSNVAIGFSH
jgi:hypothetical protein